MDLSRVPCELEVEEGSAPSALGYIEPHSKLPTSVASTKVTFPCGPGRQVVARSTLDCRAYTAAVLGHLWEVTGQSRHGCQLPPDLPALLFAMHFSDLSGRSSLTSPNSIVLHVP